MKSFFRRTLTPRLASRSFFWHKSLTGGSGKAAMPDSGGSDETYRQNPEVRAPFLERVWTWLHATFPERQIYIRSNGRVQFFTFGPSLQATLAGLTLIFLGWVAFATVNVIFKDRIIAAKDHRYQQMQTAYENRVADLQMSYDELNGALVSAEDRFKSTADALAAKQNAIAGFLNRANQVEATVGGHNPSAPASAPMDQAGPATQASAPIPAPASGAMDVDAPADVAADEASSSALVMMPGPAQPQPRTARPVKSSALDSAMQRFAELFKSVTDSVHIATHPVRDTSAAYAQHPGLRALGEQTDRVARIGGSETLLMAKTEGTLEQGVGDLRNVMRRTGINPDGFARKIAAGEGMGGPEIPLDQVRIEGISDPKFTQAYLGAAAVLDQLNGLSAAMGHVPLSTPVSTASFDKSSGFGPRVDPFTGRYAFHPGIDFAGPWGSVVHATAPGMVVFAGNRGGYGNMVEVDHGYGIHTRYGHLSMISVRVGARIDRGAALGRVGSTGRSTGPHVHYEVWYDDVVKNPNNFIEAGRHVL
ncbi:MAG TPA: peptidoglycan DD-metalloendopeptidase family protein [Rhizomicrobium sp.]|jgi:murein DD-endopeptidase MepM/ murein hydrolase activator NlpD|nr:peptidoglycan DD-metalloendopeptidase family protein [Rhizomicrobium sp.]